MPHCRQMKSFLQITRPPGTARKLPALIATLHCAFVRTLAPPFGPPLNGSLGMSPGNRKPVLHEDRSWEKAIAHDMYQEQNGSSTSVDRHPASRLQCLRSREQSHLVAVQWTYRERHRIELARRRSRLRSGTAASNRIRFTYDGCGIGKDESLPLAARTFTRRAEIETSRPSGSRSGPAGVPGPQRRNKDHLLKKNDQVTTASKEWKSPSLTTRGLTAVRNGRALRRASSISSRRLNPGRWINL